MKGVLLLMLALGSMAVYAQPLHHIVLVSFSEASTKAQRQRIIDDSLTLLRAIPGVTLVTAGNKARADRAVHITDFDVGIYVQLENEQALDAYSAHPKHQQLLRNNKAAIAGIKVIDFSGDVVRAGDELNKK